MKTKLNSLFKIIVILLVVLKPFNFIFAQCTNFIAASIQESTTGATYHGVVHTGNDVKTSIFNSIGYMKVFVWDDPNGNHPGLGWDDGTHKGYTNLANQYAFDPDVALVEESGDWYALVVYTDPTNSYICILDVYVWDNVNYRFDQYQTGFPILFSNSTGNSVYANSINIDADELGNFGIIWDDSVSSPESRPVKVREINNLRCTHLSDTVS